MRQSAILSIKFRATVTAFIREHLGDLVFFNTMRRPFSHVGIYLGDKRFLHAPAAGKSVNIVDMREPYWAVRFDGARRIGF